MTEEDTFNVLRRTPYRELEDIILSTYGDAGGWEIEEAIIRQHGWNVNEFWNKYYSDENMPK